jgi:hypothetical protein
MYRKRHARSHSHVMFIIHHFNPVLRRTASLRARRKGYAATIALLKPSANASLNLKNQESHIAYYATKLCVESLTLA